MSITVTHKYISTEKISAVVSNEICLKFLKSVRGLRQDSPGPDMYGPLGFETRLSWSRYEYSSKSGCKNAYCVFNRNKCHNNLQIL